MALKLKLTKAEHDALDASLKVQYIAKGEGFELDVEGGIEDPGELRRAKDREVEARKAAVAENTTLKTQLGELQTKYTTLETAKGDIAVLERSWQAKLDAQKVESGAEIAKRDRFIETTLVDGVANVMASELSGEHAAVLTPHIKGRLKADLSGDSPVTKVMDKDGKPSALSIEELKKEFAGDKRFAPIIVASKASGGGAAGGSRKDGGAVPVPGGKKFAELSEQERIEWNKTDPTAFKQASDDSRRRI